jgi:hypothetical protein
MYLPNSYEGKLKEYQFEKPDPKMQPLAMGALNLFFI